MNQLHKIIRYTEHGRMLVPIRQNDAALLSTNDTYSVTLTLEQPLIDGDIVMAAGARLERYFKNPVVLWNHRRDIPPIGRSQELSKRPGIGIDSIFSFSPPGLDDIADKIHTLWRTGIINAVSIGFFIHDWIRMDGKEKGKNWWDDLFTPKKITDWELFEFSIVPIGVDANAVRHALPLMYTGETRRRLQRRLNDELNDNQSSIQEPELQAIYQQLSNATQLLKEINHARPA